MTTVEVFADITCPFTHVGLRRVVDELGDDVDIRVRAWPLEWVNGEPMLPGPVGEKAAALRDQLQIDAFAGLRADRWPTTTIPALNLVDEAYRHGAADGLAVSMAVREALFERGLDIADADVLAVLAADHDLTPPGREPSRGVVDDYEDGRRRGVRGSPDFFVTGREFFCPSLDIGRDDHGDLVAHFDSAGFDRFIDAVRDDAAMPG